MAVAEIGIIGGTGVYTEGMLENAKILDLRTPYGKPSSKINIGTYRGRKIAFIFRHGERHTLPPHKVNAHANIEALRKLGVERVIGIAAVGSLREAMKPGDIVIPDQFIDMTQQRKTTFYDGPKVIHVSMADPFCREMHSTAYEVIKKLRMRFHNKGTYVCVEGPRFSTRAESHLWRLMKADIIGMTLVPEVILAREKEMCYLTIATVTDYDCWRKDEAVSAEEVVRVMQRSNENVKKILDNLIPRMPRERQCACKTALENATL